MEDNEYEGSNKNTFFLEEIDYFGSKAIRMTCTIPDITLDVNVHITTLLALYNDIKWTGLVAEIGGIEALYPLTANFKCGVNGNLIDQDTSEKINALDAIVKYGKELDSNEDVHLGYQFSVILNTETRRWILGSDEITIQIGNKCGVHIRLTFEKHEQE